MPLESPGPRGVPRRFSVRGMLILVTLFAFLISLLRVLGCPAQLFAAILMFFAGVTAAQVLLFKGRRPPLASACAGAVLLPLLVVLYYATEFLDPTNASSKEFLIFAGVGTALLVPVGVLIGLMAGAIAAGSYCSFEDLAERMPDAHPHLGLEPCTADDLSTLLSWIDSPDLLRHWSQGTLAPPLDRGQLEQRLPPAGDAQPARLCLKAINLRNNDMMGYVELAGIDRTAASARLELPLVNPIAHDRCAWSVALLTAAWEHAAEQGIRHLQAELSLDCASMVMCFTSAGFVNLGLHPADGDKASAGWHWRLTWRAGAER